MIRRIDSSLTRGTSSQRYPVSRRSIPTGEYAETKDELEVDLSKAKLTFQTEQLRPGKTPRPVVCPIEEIVDRDPADCRGFRRPLIGYLGHRGKGYCPASL